MANEIEIEGAIPGRATFALVKNSAGKFWNGVSFANYLTANRADYAQTLTELGSASGIFQADFPADITTGGSYRYIVYQYGEGATGPDEATDVYVGGGTVDWTGTAAVVTDPDSSSAGSDWLDYVKHTFKREDKDTEILEATTDAIQIMRRKFNFDEAQIDANTTATISAAGQYKIALESDMGLLTAVILQDSDIAVPLTRISKAQYDAKYPDVALNIFPGYPKHYTVYAGKIYIGPLPDRTTYTYRLNYSKRGGVITASTTSVPFTDLYRDVLKNCTLWQLNLTLEKWDSAAAYKTLFDEGFEDSKTREKRNRGDGTFTVTPFMS